MFPQKSLRRLSRMKATGVDVKVGRYSYEGSLIDEVYRDEVSREYVIRLNPRLRTYCEPHRPLRGFAPAGLDGFAVPPP